MKNGPEKNHNLGSFHTAMCVQISFNSRLCLRFYTISYDASPCWLSENELSSERLAQSEISSRKWLHCDMLLHSIILIQVFLFLQDMGSYATKNLIFQNNLNSFKLFLQAKWIIQKIRESYF